MTRAREIMNENVECIGENEPVLLAAQRMADLKVGAMPVCGSDNRIKGVITDRDIVVKVLRAGKDPAQGGGRPLPRSSPAQGPLRPHIRIRKR